MKDLPSPKQGVKRGRQNEQLDELGEHMPRCEKVSGSCLEERWSLVCCGSFEVAN